MIQIIQTEAAVGVHPQRRINSGVVNLSEEVHWLAQATAPRVCITCLPVEAISTREQPLLTGDLLEEPADLTRKAAYSPALLDLDWISWSPFASLCATSHAPGRRRRRSLAAHVVGLFGPCWGGWASCSKPCGSILFIPVHPVSEACWRQGSAGVGQRAPQPAGPSRAAGRGGAVFEWELNRGGGRGRGGQRP